MTKINDITSYIERLAPLSSQESYDNSGLIVGNQNQEITNVLVSLDCIESTVDEAIERGCNLIVSHHPIVFKGLKKINGTDYIQRTILKAIKNDIAIYACHTNLDNYRFGVNYEIAESLGLADVRILSPKLNVLNKLVCCVPRSHVKVVSEAMYKAGAGNIGDYSECSFSVSGEGMFTPGENSSPHIGEIGKSTNVQEERFEVVCSSHQLDAILNAMRLSHPYEEIAYDVLPLMNANDYEGSGMVGDLTKAMDEVAFLTFLKSTFNCAVIRHSKLSGGQIKKVAFCGGSGSFLLPAAKRSGADVFITGDYKYHDFFDAENEIIIADIGHFESEQYTSNRIATILKKKFTTFAVHLTEVNTNPINYF